MEWLLSYLSLEKNIEPISIRDIPNLLPELWRQR